MSNTLEEIATKLQKAIHKVDKQEEKTFDLKAQVIYAFNGTGKTRLSREFKNLIVPKSEDEDSQETRDKILYYNAFTEDLFFWDNDIINDMQPKLNIQPNTFIDWILNTQGEQNIINTFQRYTNDKLTPIFVEKDIIENGKKTGQKTYPYVTFSFQKGDSSSSDNVKISKGEESNFIWSIFYILIEEVINELNKIEEEYDETNPFHSLEYIFIDDPVSSLDENHLIDLAIDLASLIKKDTSKIKFVITTHNPLFYNVLHHELDGKEYKKYILKRLEDNSYTLNKQKSDSPFAYHHNLIEEIEKAIKAKDIHKYHFNYVRNILEKTATFFGKNGWGSLLPIDPDNNDENLYARVINLYSHSKHSYDEVSEVEERHKPALEYLLKHIKKLYEPNLIESKTTKEN